MKNLKIIVYELRANQVCNVVGAVSRAVGHAYCGVAECRDACSRGVLKIQRDAGLYDGAVSAGLGRRADTHAIPLFRAAAKFSDF